ncbi:MAG: hypothetical protein WA434_14900 [Candidatus Acidiferrales bacterium]
MKSIYRILGCIGLLLCFASFPLAADRTWMGQIVDSYCAASPVQMSAEHRLTEHDCTLACVKLGAKYEFVSGGKTYKIANQDFADLQVNAGDTVHLTGTLSGDTLTVSKIERDFDGILQSYVSLADTRTIVRELQKTTDAATRAKLIAELRILDKQRLDLLDQMDASSAP